MQIFLIHMQVSSVRGKEAAAQTSAGEQIQAWQCQLPAAEAVCTVAKCCETLSLLALRRRELAGQLLHRKMKYSLALSRNCFSSGAARGYGFTMGCSLLDCFLMLAL